mmetsp:Transcript_24401/g.61807  ORF Transcript_24401/g.61807 Transcript_24401/m.61807 type:complete len:207 (-) Transcript_24401:276-896(-)
MRRRPHGEIGWRRGGRAASRAARAEPTSREGPCPCQTCASCTLPAHRARRSRPWPPRQCPAPPSARPWRSRRVRGRERAPWRRPQAGGAQSGSVRASRRGACAAGRRRPVSLSGSPRPRRCRASSSAQSRARALPSIPAMLPVKRVRGGRRRARLAPTCPGLRQAFQRRARPARPARQAAPPSGSARPRRTLPCAARRRGTSPPPG